MNDNGKKTLFSDICQLHIFGGDYKVVLDVQEAKQGSLAFAIITLKAQDNSWDITIYEHREWVVRAAMKVNEGTNQDAAELWKKFQSEGKVQVVKDGGREYVNVYPVEDHAESLTVRHELRIEQNLPEPEKGCEELWMRESRAKDFAVRAAIWTLAKEVMLRSNVPAPKPKDRGRLIAPPLVRESKPASDVGKVVPIKPTPAPPASTDESAPTAQAALAQA